MAKRLQIRRDSTSNWTSSNPTLAEGEIGWDTTLKKGKIGDGTTAWLSLSFSIFTQAELNAKAPLASPALTGTPTAPTAAADTNTTQVATTAYVVGQASSTNPAMNGSVAVGTSLKYAREDHVHASDTSRAPLASPALTGTPTTPNPTIPTGIANKRYVDTVSINTQTTSYSLVLSDAGKLIEMNSSNPNTLTIPLDSSINFDIGTSIDVYQYGTGQTTIAGDVGVTIRSSGNKLNLTSQYSAATLVKRAVNDWVIMGDLS